MSWWWLCAAFVAGLLVGIRLTTLVVYRALWDTDPEWFKSKGYDR